MRIHLLAVLALAGCWEEKEEDETAPESSGVDVMAYENGHPLLTETEHSEQLAVEDALLRMTNEHRASVGVAPVLPHPVARQEARAVARHMRVHSFVGHDNPEGEGPADRLLRVGLEFEACGENLAWGWDSAQKAFAFWLGSAPHRANLENPDWTHAGMGFWSGGRGYGTYFAQEFLRMR